jgi:predicted NBD/HSP70 family sugar kinase
MADSEAAVASGDIIVGVDIGGTKTALLAWEPATESVLAQDAFATPVDLGPTEFVERLASAIEALVGAAGRPSTAMRALGVAVPGLVDAAAGRVLTAGNLAGWTDVPLAALLTERLAVPVQIERDANAAALGERWRGAARDFTTFAFVALGTGVGAGIVLDGRLHRGAHFAAGELGDLVVDRDELGRPRAGQGDLAHRLGGKTLRRRARQATGESLSAAEAIALGDAEPDLAPLAEDAVDDLALAMVAIAALLDPEAIIVGGGTAEAGEALLGRARTWVERETAAPPRMLAAALGPEAQLYGAVFAALEADGRRS